MVLIKLPTCRWQKLNPLHVDTSSFTHGHIRSRFASSSQDQYLLKKQSIASALAGHSLQSQRSWLIHNQSADSSAHPFSWDISHRVYNLNRFDLHTLPASSATRFTTHLHPSSSFSCYVWFSLSLLPPAPSCAQRDTHCSASDCPRLSLQAHGRAGRQSHSSKYNLMKMIL